MLNGHILHEYGYKGEGMQIAVIDAGFTDADILPAFDSLWINNQILGNTILLMAIIGCLMQAHMAW